MPHFIRKIKEVGICNTIVGSIKRIRNASLQRKYGFDVWHVNPYELKEYNQVVVKYVNSHSTKDTVVVDIGCGLGDIIRNIKTDNRYGMDLDSTAIPVAKMLDKSKKVDFTVGTLTDLGPDFFADFLITVGFLHGYKEDSWQPLYDECLNKNDIKTVIVDTLPDGINGSNHLDFTKILPGEYKLVDKMGPYLSGRYIEVYQK